MKHLLKCLLSGLVSLLLAACAPKAHWVKYGATQTSFDKDFAQCKYEATLATATIGTGRTYGTSDAISQGVSAGITAGFKQVDLIKLCMQKEGYRLEPIKES